VSRGPMEKRGAYRARESGPALPVHLSGVSRRRHWRPNRPRCTRKRRLHRANDQEARRGSSLRSAPHSLVVGPRRRAKAASASHQDRGAERDAVRR
jgi:hypothetical protein